LLVWLTTGWLNPPWGIRFTTTTTYTPTVWYI
jgi:hypothetical protein